MKHEQCSVTHLKLLVVSDLAAAHASMTARPKSAAPAPPSAQWLATTAAVAPAAMLRLLTSSSSASVSVENLFTATTAATPNFWMFLM